MVPLSRLQAFIGQQLQHQDEAMDEASVTANDSFDSILELDDMGLNLQWACDPLTILDDLQVRSVPAAIVVPPAMTVESTSILVPAAESTLTDGGFQLSSVLKKRHRKMKRHKYKKWRKKYRNLLRKK
jgi:hypothetical protein